MAKHIRILGISFQNRRKPLQSQIILALTDLRQGEQNLRVQDLGMHLQVALGQRGGPVVLPAIARVAP